MAPVLFLVGLLSGCSDTYPEDLLYPVRTDPLVVPSKVPDKIVYVPDRPGQLPLLTFGDLNDPHNPLHELKNVADSVRDPLTSLDAAQRGKIEKTLNELFGRPAAPKVAVLKTDKLAELTNPEVIGADPSDRLAEVLKGLGMESLTEETYTKILEDLGLKDEKRLAEGSKLYRSQCLHCHGLTGDGRGPSARWVNPHPRDYRLGKFKFTSTNQIESLRKPRREDLLRILRQGIDGSSMPSFGLLSEDELQNLVSYVIHLSLRGQVEFVVMDELIGLVQDKKTDEIKAFDIDAKLKTNLVSALVVQWRDAQRPERLIDPGNPFGMNGYTKEELKQSVNNGYQAFLTKVLEGNCYSCHVNFGRQTNYSFDQWGTLAKRANLTLGIYRGGRRPIDLYYRVYAGINGTGMPPSGYMPSRPNDDPHTPPLALKNDPKKDKIWDMVNFLQVLPYPRMLKEEYGIDIDAPEASKTTVAGR